MQSSLEEKIAHPGGLTLIVPVTAWLAGIILESGLRLPPLALACGVGMALFLVVILYHDRRSRFAMLLILCLLAGTLRYAMALPDNDPQTIAAFVGSTSLQIHGSIADEPRVAGHTRLLLVDVNSVSRSQNSHWTDAHGTIEVQILGTNVEDIYGANYGDEVTLSGKLQAPLPHSPPGILAGMIFPRVTVTGAGGNFMVAFLYHVRNLFASICDC